MRRLIILAAALGLAAIGFAGPAAAQNPLVQGSVPPPLVSGSTTAPLVQQDPGPAGTTIDVPPQQRTVLIDRLRDLQRERLFGDGGPRVQREITDTIQELRQLDQGRRK